MVRRKLKLKIIKNLPMVFIISMLIIGNVYCICISGQISEMRNELMEIEMSNTVIALSASKKKVPVVSSKFFNEYLPSAEGFSDTVYICASGNRTIGYGTNISKNSIEVLLECNYISSDDSGRYTMTKYQAKRAAGLWIAENHRYFEQFSEKYIGMPFEELPQQIKDFIVLIAYKSGGRGLIENKKEVGLLIGEFIDGGMETEIDCYDKMISAAGGDSNRQCIYRSIFE